nr:translation initiation factor 1 [uncultured Cupriavidus sp.]
MSASHEWKEMHLTPEGWVPGSEKWDFGPVEHRPVPPDAVLTICRTEHVSSSFSPLERTFEETKLSADEALIESLRLKFGASPFAS